MIPIRFETCQQLGTDKLYNFTYSNVYNNRNAQLVANVHANKFFRTASCKLLGRVWKKLWDYQTCYEVYQKYGTFRARAILSGYSLDN